MVKGLRHDCLGVHLDHSKKGKVIIDVKAHVRRMIEEFPQEIKDNVNNAQQRQTFSMSMTVQNSTIKEPNVFAHL